MNTARVNQEPGYRPEIDGLRAVAVLAVILNHIDSSVLPSGHLGVDVFFVISGFVISSSLYARDDTSFSALLSGFYVRRVKRLLPALVACVAITGVAICLFDPSPGASLKTGLAALFGVSNIYLFLEATDYFGKPAQLNVFTHTWSLGVEEQFYLAFPLLVWLTWFARTGALRSFAITVGVLSTLALAAFVYLSRTHEAAAFYLMPTRFWELGIGCLAFAVSQNAGALLRFLRRFASPLALLVALCAVFFVPGEFSVAATVSVVLATALLILAVRPGTLGYRLLSQSWVVYVGLISYSLYLWHWSVLSLSRWTVGVDWSLAPFQVALMFLLAGASYRYLEEPLRRARWGSRGWETAAYGAGASLSTAVLLVALGTVLEQRLYTGQPPRMLAKGVATLSDPYRDPANNLVWLGAPCVVSSNKEVDKVISVHGCTLGDFGRAARRVLVVGNSLSAAFVRGFDELVVKDGYAITVTAAWGARGARGTPGEASGLTGTAYYWSAVVPLLVAQLKPGDAVFYVRDLTGWLRQGSPEDSAALLEGLRREFERLSSDLRGRGIDLYVLHANPFTGESGCEPDMAAPQWFSPFGRPCRYYSRAESLARRAPLDAMLTSLSERGKIKVVDLFDLFCPGELCTHIAANGQILYRDAYAHPSVEAVLLAAPTVRRALLRDCRPGLAVGDAGGIAHVARSVCH